MQCLTTVRQAKQEKLKARGTSLAAQHAAIEAAEKEHVEKALAKFKDMKDKELKKELESRDLSTKGQRDDYMERLTEAVTKDAKKAAKKAQAEKEKKAEEDDKMFDGMSKAHLKRVLEKKGLETKGKKAELIERIKSAGIDVAKELDPAEAAGVHVPSQGRGGSPW